MNYFIDLIPTESFIDKLTQLKSEYPEDTFIMNLFIEQLPAMNINRELYLAPVAAEKTLDKLHEAGLEVNIMMDSFCFGNLEFAQDYTRKIMNMLGTVLRGWITITNFFYYRWIRRKYPDTKIIFSEYVEAGNSQKLSRYLEDIGADGVKIDIRLAKDRESIDYVRKNFSPDSIHINLNRGDIENNIFSDSLNTNIAHYIQKEKWDRVYDLLRDFRKRVGSDFPDRLLYLSESDFKYLSGLGFTNFWINCISGDETTYLQNITKLLNGEFSAEYLYPWFAVGTLN